MSDFFQKAREKSHVFVEHADYKVNFSLSLKMIEKWRISDSPEIWCSIRDSEHYKKCLFTISFTPDKRAPMGKYSGIVGMHQPKESFMKECESIRKATLNLFKRYSEVYKNEIPKWQKIDESYWQEYVGRYQHLDMHKLVNNLGLSFKSTQSQGIKC